MEKSVKRMRRLWGNVREGSEGEEKEKSKEIVEVANTVNKLEELLIDFRFGSELCSKGIQVLGIGKEAKLLTHLGNGN